MRVLMTSQGVPDERYPMNGIHQFCYAKALQKRGIEVTFCALDTRSIIRWRRLGLFKTKKDGIECYIYNRPIETNQPLKNADIAARAFQKLYQFVTAERDFDMIHAHFYNYAYPVAVLNNRPPLVVSEHSSIINKEDIHSLKAGIREVCLKTYEKAQAVVVGSPFFKKRMKMNFGVDPIVMPTVINDGFFEVGQVKAPFFKIVSTGNLIQSKGHRELITAFFKCFKDSNAKMFIFGQGPDEKYLKKMIEEYGLSDKIILRGQATSAVLADEYRSAHLFALASHSETYGKVYVEAMAAGLPILMVDNGGAEQFVTDKTGLIAQKENAEDLARKLKQMYQNWSDYDAQYIRQFQQENFSEEFATQSLIALYKKILAGQ